MPPTINEELILSQVKLYLNDEVKKMNESVEKQVEKIFTDRITPLIGQVAQQSAELAAERAVKKYCARIGLDFDNIEHMREHALDMDLLRKIRKERENVKAIIFNATVKGIVTAIIAGAIAALTSELYKGR